MKKHALLKRGTAAALLSATIALPAAVGLTAGTANAVPREINCVAIAQAVDDYMYVAGMAYDQGDIKAGDDHMKSAHVANANYNRYCLS